MTDEQLCERLDKAIAQEMIAMWFLVQKVLKTYYNSRDKCALALYDDWQPRFEAMLYQCKETLKRDDVFPNVWIWTDI